MAKYSFDAILHVIESIDAIKYELHQRVTSENLFCVFSHENHLEPPISVYYPHNDMTASGRFIYAEDFEKIEKLLRKCNVPNLQDLIKEIKKAIIKM